jgi:hypothetical protein
MEIIQVSDNFWNIRGSFKIGGVVDIGTQASLVKRQNGEFVLLDTCGLSTEVATQIDALTNGGKDIKAILNLHPFHTVYVSQMHERYPHALLYGTARHVARAPALPWQPEHTESPEIQTLFAEDFEFSVPKGVDFISKNENIHFSSVLVYHRASKTIHVDDTLMFSKLPGVLNLIGMSDVLNFHPTLAVALEKRASAADDFETWTTDIVERWQDAENLCAAHTAPLLGRDNSDDAIAERILNALGRVKWLLATHRLRFGAKGK